MYDLTTLNEQRAAPSASASQPQSGRTSVSLGNMIERIEEAIDIETDGIRHNRDFDLKASNARKSRHLYELSRAVKGIGSSDILVEHRGAIERLREKLAVNERVIKAHLSAVGEVAKLVQDAIERSEADGTYSAHEFGQF